jgi:Nuclear cap-binding protein subunit 3
MQQIGVVVMSSSLVENEKQQVTDGASARIAENTTSIATTATTSHEEEVSESIEANNDLPWSERRRLSANPSEQAIGFPTGLDIHTPEEKMKQAKRLERFGLASEVALQLMHKEISSTANGAVDVDADMDMMSIEQAWDKYDWVGIIFRVDPPPHLWRYPLAMPESSIDGSITEDMGAAKQRLDNTMDATFVSEKIHICSIDWVAFKQIRSPDIMAYFTVYGPTYVEWLNDLSCNVHFADQYSASRAMQYLSQEIPSPPPLLSNRQGKNTISIDIIETGMQGERPDLGRMGWRIGNTMLRKVKNDKYGLSGTTARLLMRVATSLDILLERPNEWPIPPTAFTARQVLGPQSDVRPTTKTDIDTPTNVISDSTKRKKKRRQEKRNRSRKDDPSEGREDPEDNKVTQQRNHGKRNTEARTAVPTTEAWMNNGLSATRAGFSVEDMELERASKKKRM